MSQAIKGYIGGACLIAYGLVGAVWTYISDSNSMEYFRINNAVALAELHAGIFCGLGVAVVAGFWLFGKRDDFDQ